jgi:hypothetical protein
MKLRSSSLGRNSIVWAVAALVLWLCSGMFDRKTDVEILSDGRRLHLEVAGTTLSAPLDIQRVTGVEIRAMDSIDPPRGRRITITDDQGIIIDEPLPRFHFPSGGMTPVGDWDIDENAPHGTVWRRQLAITGAFTVAARFKGRFHHDLEVVLLGEQAASVAFRRGLINHDVFIRASDGAKLAVTSIDPTPLADIGSILAIVMRAMAVACLLIGLFSFIASRSRPSPRPAAEPRWMAAPWAWVLALSAAAFSIWVARDVLECLPHLPDSVTYLVQARWLLDGDLWKPLSAIQEHLDIPYTYVVGERWLAHYPPGWPLLRSVGLAIGLPWLVAPVLGAVFVILLYATGREIDGPVTGLLAATLGLLSPQVRVQRSVSSLASGRSRPSRRPSPSPHSPSAIASRGANAIRNTGSSAGRLAAQ